MPALPRHESERSLTTQQPSPLAPEGIGGKMYGLVAENAKAASGALETVYDAGQKWNKEVNTMRANQSMYAMRLDVQGISERAAVEQDPNKVEEYKKEIANAYEKYNTGFTDPRISAEVQQKLGYESLSAQIQLDGLFKKKMIVQQRASSSDQATDMVNHPTGDLTADIQRVKDFYDGSVNPLDGLENVNLKIYSPEERQKLRVESEKDMKMNTFLQEFRNDPKKAEQKFEANAYGMTIEDQEKARSKIKEIKRMDREAQTENVANASLAIFSGDMTEKTIDKMIEVNKSDASQGVTEKQGMQLKAALYRDISARIGVKEFKEQKKAIDFIFADAKQDRMTMYESVLNAYKDGVTPEESGFLHKIATMKKDVIFARKAADGKKFLETLLGARAKDIKEETENMLRYAQRISNGMEPEEASRETALEVVQRDHPATVGDPDLAGTFSPTKGFRPVQKVKRDESSTGKGR